MRDYETQRSLETIWLGLGAVIFFAMVVAADLCGPIPLPANQPDASRTAMTTDHHGMKCPTCGSSDLEPREGLLICCACERESEHTATATPEPARVRPLEDSNVQPMPGHEMEYADELRRLADLVEQGAIESVAVISVGGQDGLDLTMLHEWKQHADLYTLLAGLARVTHRVQTFLDEQ